MRKAFGKLLLPALTAALTTAAAASGFAAAHLQQARLGLPGGKAILVDLAVTPEEHERGLMFRSSLPEDYGMLFVFPTQEKLQFWMKNTWVDLDMVFIDREKRITAIYQNVPRSYPETPESSLARRDGEGQYVLEMPAGASKRYHLKKGQRLIFPALPAPGGRD